MAPLDRRIGAMMARNGRPDTAVDVAARIRRRVAGDQAVADRCSKFPVLTGENAEAAIAYQDSRFAFYMAGNDTPFESYSRFHK